MINRFWGVPGVIYFKGLRLKFRPRKYIRIFPSKFKILMLLEFLINFLIYSIGDNNLIKKETNEYLLNQIKKECIKNNSELIILCLDNLENLSKFLNKNDFNWNYSGINLDEENTKGEKKWLLMPWDNHPNNDANSIFADKILKVINSSKRPFNPKIEIIKKNLIHKNTYIHFTRTMKFKNLGLLFKEQAKKNYKDICLNLGKENLISYGKIDSLSDSLASYFYGEQGIREGDRVCIESKKDLFSYAALLSCLKLGVIYSFFDINDGEDRIKNVIETVKLKNIFLFSKK